MKRLSSQLDAASPLAKNFGLPLPLDASPWGLAASRMSRSEREG